MLPLMTILLATAATAAAAPLAEQLRRSSRLGGYAGGFARYEPLPPRAVSHMRQQLFAAAPRARLERYASGFHTHTLHASPFAAATAYAPAYAPAYAQAYTPASSYHPAYATSSSYHPAYGPTYATSSSYQPAYAATPPGYAGTLAASTLAPAYEEADEYYVEDSDEEPVYFTEASDALVLASAAPEIYDTVMYARPNERGGYSYRRRPARRPARRPPPRRSPYILKIHKTRIVRD